MKRNLTWFDGKGSVTLIDNPHIPENKAKDEPYLKKMEEHYKRNVDKIDLFILMLVYDRLACGRNMELIKLYEQFSGGEVG